MDKTALWNPNDCISKDDLKVFKRNIQLNFFESMSSLVARVTHHDQFYANA